MSFPYPPKPWSDGDQVQQLQSDGTVITATYSMVDNVWKMVRTNPDSDLAYVTDKQVFITNDGDGVAPVLKLLDPLEDPDSNATLYDRNKAANDLSRKTVRQIYRVNDGVDFLNNTVSSGLWVHTLSDQPAALPGPSEFFLFDENDNNTVEFKDVKKIIFAGEGTGALNANANLKNTRVGDNLLIQENDENHFGYYVVDEIEVVGQPDLGGLWFIQMIVRVAFDRALGDSQEFSHCTVKVFRPLFVQNNSNPPILSENGQLWYNPTTNTLSVWDNDQGKFYPIGGESGDGTVTVGPTPPLDPYEGQLWFDTERLGLYIRYGVEWIPTGDSSANLEYVAKSGDTMTGRLFLESNFDQIQEIYIGERFARQPGGRPTGDAANATDAYFWHLRLQDCTTTPKNEVKLQWNDARDFIDNWNGEPFHLLITTVGTGAGQYWLCQDPGWVTGANTWHINTNEVQYALSVDAPDIAADQLCQIRVLTADRPVPYITSVEAYAEAKVVVERAVDGLATEEYVDEAVANAGGSSYTPPSFWQSNTGYENIIRPGEFGLRDRNDSNTLNFSETRSIWFTYTDKDGNTPFIHSRTKDWTGYFTGPLYLMKDDEVIFQVAAGSGVNQLVLLDGALNSYGIYYIAWTDDSVAQTTAGFSGVTQGGQYQLHIPSLLKP
jgi:hypothetical protein